MKPNEVQGYLVELNRQVIPQRGRGPTTLDELHVTSNCANMLAINELRDEMKKSAKDLAKEVANITTALTALAEAVKEVTHELSKRDKSPGSKQVYSMPKKGDA